LPAFPLQSQVAMDPLRIAHQFFHFSLKQWEHVWAGIRPETRDLQRLFKEDVFPRRTLQTGEVRSLEEALCLLDSVLESERRAGVRSIPVSSPFYPKALRDHLPPERLPVFLHLRGADLPEEQSAVSIVGTRFPSRFGTETAKNFASYFTVLGLRTISGLAKGIDTIVHSESLSAGTVAVLGGGILGIYPRENEPLAERILQEGGTLASPFPLRQVPLPRNFPRRNELIAAISTGTVVIEGAETSGAAVTGKQSLEMGKCVIVLAQDFRTRFGRGAIRLHQAGATFAASEEEALQALFARLGGFSRMELPNLSKRQRIFSLEEFRAAAGTDIRSALVLLEEGISEGRIERLSGARFRLTNPH
jgi:DNA protecting protein DprA